MLSAPPNATMNLVNACSRIFPISARRAPRRLRGDLRCGASLRGKPSNEGAEAYEPPIVEASLPCRLYIC